MSNTYDKEQVVKLQSTIILAVKIIEPLLFAQEQKIYELTEAVVKGLSFEWNQDAYVALYQKLYITQAALCRLSQKLDANSVAKWVEISPVSARIQVVSTDIKSMRSLSGRAHPEQQFSGQFPSGQSLPDALSRPNEAFFLDPENFFGVTADDVQNLLTKFWKNFDAHENKHDAYAKLGLSPTPEKDVSWHEIQSAYRKKAALYHPDKGGNTQAFIEIRAAYDRLKKLFMTKT